MVAAILLAAAISTSAASPAFNTAALGGGAIDLELEGAGAGVSDAAIRAYVDRAAKAVALYYGRFPVKHVEIDVTRGGRLHIGHGVTYLGWKIRIDVGAQATDADLLDDWRMTHEMFHLGFPDMDDEFLYLEEGLSTYLEPIARARAGQLPADRVWRDMMEGMPQGLPAKGDRGLDRTHTWGRTYWGGALFWLECDVAIREQTHGKKSLDDAIRAILDGGGNGAAHWDLAQVIETGDKATGTTVLRDHHARFGEKATPTDLDALWKKLDPKLRAAITSP